MMTALWLVSSVVSPIKSSYTDLSQRATQSSADDVYLWDSVLQVHVDAKMLFDILMCFF